MFKHKHKWRVVITAFIILMIISASAAVAYKCYLSKVLLSGKFDVIMDGMTETQAANIKVFGYSPRETILVLDKLPGNSVWEYKGNRNFSKLMIYSGTEILIKKVKVLYGSRETTAENLHLNSDTEADISLKLKPRTSFWAIVWNMLSWKEAHLGFIAILIMLFIYVASMFIFLKYMPVRRFYQVLWYLFVFVLLIHIFFYVYTGFYLNTSGLFMIILFMLLVYILIMFIKRLARSQKHLKEIRLSITSIALLLLLTEVLFIITGYKSTRLEHGFPGYYYSPYNTKNKKYFHTWDSNHKLVNAEYCYMRMINTEKLSDREHSIIKSENEFRIIGVGDSFTEGDGAHADSTWLKFLERGLMKYPIRKQLTFMNAGVCGSDPFYSYILVKEKLMKYKPDMVILPVNISDITDIHIRGGIDRFRPDGTVVFNKAPWWEPVYASLRISRLLFAALGYDALLCSKTKENYEADKEKIMEAVVLFNELAKKNDFIFIVAFHPLKGEINSKMMALEDVCEKLHNKIPDGVLNMMDYFIVYEGIGPSNSSEYYWTEDGHHNAKGYELFARGVEWKLKEMGIIDSLMKE
ncbi:MAG: hypothetical protein WC401_02410 [Bacteroidales bacterium]|nr:energy-coupling factor transporter transmembrane protein EcfT [Bacteroidales bacterium]